MKRVLCKSGQIDSLTDLYDALQEASIYNIKEYLKGFVITPGLRSEGDMFLVRLDQSRLRVALGACVFDNYEVFVAPENTELYLDLPDFQTTNSVYYIIMKQGYSYSHEKDVIPFDDGGSEVTTTAYALRRVNVSIELSSSGDTLDNEILLASVTSVDGEVVVNNARHLNTMEILSYYASWGLSAIAMVNVSGVDSFSLESHTVVGEGPQPPSMQKMTFVRVHWPKPTVSSIGVRPGPIYYKVVLTPVVYDTYPGSGGVAHEDASIEAYRIFKTSDTTGKYMSATLPAREGVVYRANVYQVSGPSGLVVSGTGLTKLILAGAPPATEMESGESELTLTVFGPGMPPSSGDWQSRLYFIRPQTGSSDSRRYQLFIAEHSGAGGSLLDITTKEYLYYDGPPKAVFYRPSGLANISMMGRIIGDGGRIVAASTVHTYSQGASVYAAHEDVIAVKAPLTEDIWAIPTGIATSRNIGYFYAPYNMIVTKIAVTNPYTGEENYYTINDDVDIELTGTSLISGDYEINVYDVDDGEATKVFEYNPGEYPEIPAGELITVTATKAGSSNPVPDGLVILVYARRVIS